MKKYKLIDSDINGLYRIQALRDFNDVKSGDVGGYVTSEYNLSHDDDCWIDANARVYGYVTVCESVRIGNAAIYGDARVYGDPSTPGSPAIIKRTIYITEVPRHNIIVTDNYVNIGCEQHTLEYWLSNYEDIGNKYDYTKDEIATYRKLLEAITMMVNKY